jgi:hypothetical protein
VVTKVWKEKSFVKGDFKHQTKEVKYPDGSSFHIDDIQHLIMKPNFDVIYLNHILCRLCQTNSWSDMIPIFVI